MKKLLLTLVFLTSLSFANASFAEGTGDYCADRLAAITWFGYEHGYSKGVLDLDDQLRFSKLRKKGREKWQKKMKEAEKNFNTNLKLLKKKKCLKLIKEY